jgi:hypothetical protein
MKRPERILLVAAGAPFLLAFLWIAWRRVDHPIGLEVLEEGVASLALRVAAGEPLYSEPTLDFVPLLYGPLYPWLGGALFAVLGPELAWLRLLAVAATLVVLLLLFVAARASARAGQGTSGPAFSGGLAGWLAAFWLAACYDYDGAWFDIARVDVPALALALAACLLLKRTRGAPWAASLLATLAFLTKQTTLPMLVVFGLGDALAHRRRGLWFVGGTLLGAGASAAVLHASSGGWSTYFLLEMPARHGWRWDLVEEVLVDEPLHFLALLVLAAGGAVVLFRRHRREAAAPLGLLLAALAVGCTQRLRQGGFVNVLIPAHAALVWFAAIGVAAAVRSSRPVALGATALALLQCGLLLYDPRVHVPSERARANAEHLAAVLHDLDGPLLAPSHSYTLLRTGKREAPDGTALWDLDRDAAGPGSPLRAQLLARLQQGHYRALLLDDPGYAPIVQAHYPSALPAFPAAEHGHTRTPRGFESLTWFAREADAPRIRRR